MIETPFRIEPAYLEETSAQIADVIAELSSASGMLAARLLHPVTAANLAGLVRRMNCYYSNLIEGHNTRPRDIERALSGDFDADRDRRNLQLEAAAHIRVQQQIDSLAAADKLPEPASCQFIQWLHQEFYRDAPAEMLLIGTAPHNFRMELGQWRSRVEQDNVVGRHIPPSSAVVATFMDYFEKRYRFHGLGHAGRMLAMAAAHHRFNYIHPFPDGNGRVSRLMSHAMALRAGIGAHGLWSVSRGLARGLESRLEYKQQMDHADMPRQGERDGRGNLSHRALADFTLWFLKVCHDQVTFMAGLFDLNNLAERLARSVQQNGKLKPEASRLLHEALMRGEFDRGDAARICGLPERSARRLLGEVIDEGLLASATAKGPVSLRFPAHTLEILFPQLYPQS
jgi:Fic family protein